MTIPPGEHHVGYSIKETPKVFRDEWAGFAKKATGLEYSKLISSLDIFTKEKQAGGSLSQKIAKNTFDLADFLELSDPSSITVEKFWNEEEQVSYSFHDSDPTKANRQVVVETLAGLNNFRVKLIANEAPEKYDPNNINYAQRMLTMTVKDDQKAANFVVDRRLIVNKNLVGRYEAKGIEYAYSIFPDGKLTCEANTYVDQVTEQLPSSDLKWISKRPDGGRGVENLSKAGYPINWLSANLPPDASLQGLPLTLFVKGKAESK